MKRHGVRVAFGRLVADKRKRNGLTQRSLATLLDVSRATVANIERGAQGVQLDFIFECARLLNVPVTDLIPTADQEEETVRSKRKVEWLQRIKTDLASEGRAKTE